VLVLHLITVVSSQKAMALPPPLKVKLMNDGNQHRTQ
jgi:hypothetical protein